MATYASYKKVQNDSLADGSITPLILHTVTETITVSQWIYNERGLRCPCVLDKVDVVNKQTVNAVIGVYLTAYSNSNI